MFVLILDLIVNLEINIGDANESSEPTEVSESRDDDCIGMQYIGPYWSFIERTSVMQDPNPK